MNIEKRTCRKCGDRHKVKYVTYKNLTTHLTMWCPSIKAWCMIKFEPNLDISSVLSAPALKHNQWVNNMQKSSLFEYLVERMKKSKDGLPDKIIPYHGFT